MTTAKGTILVTGANGTLGSSIAAQIGSSSGLAAYHGIYTVRDAGNAPALAAALDNSSSAPVHKYEVVSLDLTDLDNVRQVAAEINARVSAKEVPPIRALVLAAGFQDFGKQSWTKEGLDTTFAANYLGHWLLTLLLLQSIDQEAGRIVIVGSQVHDPHDPRNDRSKSFADEKYHQLVPADTAGFTMVARGAWSPASEDPSFRSGARRYGAAKLYLTMLLHELQQRLNQEPTLQNISVVGVDPGTMVSGLQRHAPWFIRVVIFQVIYPLVLWLKPDGDTVRAPSRSGRDVLEAAFGAVGEGGAAPKGLYFNGRKRFETSKEAKDAAKCQFVWKETIKHAGLQEGETVLANWQ